MINFLFYMDKYHVALIILLGISIIFLGLSAISKDDQTLPKLTNTENMKDPEIWSGKITADDVNNIADADWRTRLRTIDTEKIAGSESLCLNMCGIRCLWLGYSYKNHEILGTALWGDNETPICSCDCYVDKRQ